MLKVSNIKLPVGSEESLEDAVCKKLGIQSSKLKEITIRRCSLDARKRGQVCYVYTALALVDGEKTVLKKNIKDVELFFDEPYAFEYSNISSERRPVIIGSGPCGLFCALMLARAGLCPVVFERGECVEKRTQKLEKLRNEGILDTNSNVQFGEGGAGTFSDGKLTCGLNDVRMRFVLGEFVKAGAPEEIAYLAKPHIGTDYLKKVVVSIREEIVRYGGEIKFSSLFTDYTCLEDGGLHVEITDTRSGKKEYYDTDELVLALGHSSRDTYALLRQKGIKMQKKPFSVGVRIEHKREYINKLMYKDEHLCESLPAADYKLSCHPSGRGVYTFCMCPGGEVVCSSSEKGGVVTNGMSYFARDMQNSNSALLVSVLPEDLPSDVFSGVEFQRELERKAYELGGGGYFAPCQRVGDFLKKVPTKQTGSVSASYMPGVTCTNLWDILPDFVAQGIYDALYELDKKLKGFCFEDALLTGVETRSSAPVRIVRDENMNSSQKGIYPAGEGAGYAGGIMSAALDGIKCAEIIVKKYSKEKAKKSP